MVRMSLLLLSWLISLTVAASTADEALQAYRAAQQALKQGQLAVAEREVLNALRLNDSRSGYLLMDSELKIDMGRVGRVRTINTQSVGREVPYKPHQLLAEIKQLKEQQYALAQLEQKKLNPPQLTLVQMAFDDEDHDNILSALERGRVKIVLKNTGKSVAENVALDMRTQSYQIDELNTHLPLGDIAPGSSVSKELTFVMPEHTEDRTIISVSVRERHDLGTFVDHKVQLPSRAYLAPILRAQHLSEHSAPIIPGKAATQRFRITNVGAGTAFDVRLGFDFDYSDRVQILQSIDLASIAQIKPGDSRDISFVVRANQGLGLRTPLGLNLTTRERAGQSTQIPLTLVTNSPAQNTPASMSLLAPALPDFLATVSVKGAEAAILVSTLQQQKPGQLNNTAKIEEALLVRGIPSQFILQRTLKQANEWSDWLSGQVFEMLQQHPIQRLHVYVDTHGRWDPLTRHAKIGVETSTGAMQWANLTHFINELERLPVPAVHFYLESSMLVNDETIPAVVWQQPLISSSYRRVRVYAAAQPQAAALAYIPAGTGLFSAALAQALRVPGSDPQYFAPYLLPNIQAVGQSTHQYLPLPYFSQH